MRVITLFALAAILGAMGVASSAEPGENPVDAMQGTWTIESFILEGNTLSADQLKKWRRIVEGEHITWKNGDQVMIETDMTLDAEKSPMTLDSRIVSGDSKGQVMLAIYELRDDTLRVCFGHPGKPRPTEFSSRPASGQSMFTARLEKP
jgi:uncharacterized protein (TIGR03067 family)